MSCCEAQNAMDGTSKAASLFHEKSNEDPEAFGFEIVLVTFAWQTK